MIKPDLFLSLNCHQQSKEEEEKKCLVEEYIVLFVMSTVKQHHRTVIPSCGLTMLQAPKDTFDYTLRITSDDKIFVSVQCHRCVLTTHSERLRYLMTNENYFTMDIKVEPGYVAPTLELLQYMYLKDASLIFHKEKALKLLALFEMPLEHFLVRTEGTMPVNTYDTVQFLIQYDESSCIAATDFLKCLTFEQSKLCVAPISPTEEPVSNFHPDHPDHTEPLKRNKKKRRKYY